MDEKRNSKTNATVGQLLDRYLQVLDVEPPTREGYERYIRIHIRPMLGDPAIGRINGEVLDSFYAHLRKCRAPDPATFLKSAFGHAVRWRWIRS